MDWEQRITQRRAEYLAMNRQQRSEALGPWIRQFWAADPQQLDGPEQVTLWWLMSVAAPDAAAWEDHAEQQAGGPEALAAMRVAELLGSGALLGPDDVTIVRDPFDPNREIIAPRADPD
jgi:hypothetical protein